MVKWIFHCNIVLVVLWWMLCWQLHKVKTHYDVHKIEWQCSFCKVLELNRKNLNVEMIQQHNILHGINTLHEFHQQNLSCHNISVDFQKFTKSLGIIHYKWIWIPTHFDKMLVLVIFWHGTWCNDNVAKKKNSMNFDDSKSISLLKLIIKMFIIQI
jgi:hypothetical protein